MRCAIPHFSQAFCAHCSWTDCGASADRAKAVVRCSVPAAGLHHARWRTRGVSLIRGCASPRPAAGRLAPQRVAARNSFSSCRNPGDDGFEKDSAADLPGSAASFLFSRIPERSLARKADGFGILVGGKSLHDRATCVHERASPQASGAIGEFGIQVIVIHVPSVPFPTDHAEVAMARVKIGICQELSAFPSWSVDAEAIESIPTER